MPTYEYLCAECDKREEVNRPIELRDAHLACQVCGSLMTRTFTPVGVSFKGGGFYSTDKNR